MAVKNEVVFTEVAGTHGTFDMTVNRRAAEYDILPGEFASAIHRRRVPPDADIWVQHDSGRRERLGRR